MRARRFLIAAVLLVVVVFSVCWLLPSSEPIYLGHPISYWTEPWHHHATEPPEREAAAFAEMDDRAVRWLARQLYWRPSILKESFAAFLNHFGDFLPGKDYDGGRRDASVRALTRLGPRAKAAIPALEALSRSTVELHRDQLRAAATAALVRIRGESLQPYIDQLHTASGEQWGRLATILGNQETNAAEAVPALVAGLMQTNRVVWIEPTVAALGNIHSHSELSVPALLKQLGKTNLVSEYLVYWALGKFGPDAESASPALVQRLTGISNDFDRQALVDTLKKIDSYHGASTNGDRLQKQNIR
jgi:hypothetical protein